MVIVLCGIKLCLSGLMNIIIIISIQNEHTTRSIVPAQTQQRGTLDPRIDRSLWIAHLKVWQKLEEDPVIHQRTHPQPNTLTRTKVLQEGRRRQSQGVWTQGQIVRGTRHSRKRKITPSYHAQRRIGEQDKTQPHGQAGGRGSKQRNGVFGVRVGIGGLERSGGRA